MKTIYEILDELNIPYSIHEHPAVYTVEEASKFYTEMPGGHFKNLFLRNKKGNNHFLAVVVSTKTVDIKKLGELFGGEKLSFASPERLLKHMGLTPGAVSPFGLVNNTEHNIRVLVDNDLFTFDTVYFHPNENTASIGISPQDFQKYLEWTENPIQHNQL